MIESLDEVSILVVDSNDDTSELLSVSLRHYGWSVESAGSIADAQAKLSERNFELALVDYHLPDGEGFELLQWLADYHHETDVMLITAVESFQLAVDAMQLGVMDYVKKPLDIPALCHRVHRVIEHQGLRRRNRGLVEHLTSLNRQLQSLVVRDGLTRLYNHAHLHDALESILAQAQRQGHCVSLLLVDIDDFKLFNETHGHAVGNDTIRALARLFQQGDPENQFQLRQQDLVARFGGDEFAIVLPDTPKVGASSLAERIRHYVDTHELVSGLGHLSLSMGTATFPADADNRESLVLGATQSLYAAKRTGRNCVVSYQPGLARPDADEPSLMETAELRRRRTFEQAIETRGFDFHFQPLVNVEDCTVFGYEALCRKDEGDTSAPVELFQAAERAGRVVDLGRVLRDVMAERLIETQSDATFFFNLHPQELNDPTLLGRENPLMPFAHQIVLEITEAEAIRNYESAGRVLKQLRDAGFRVALDDLGAGYSGLNSLALLEPDFVKLDMAMLRGIGKDDRKSRLIKHIIEFAQGEDILVVAEGIETLSEFLVVQNLGCPLVQGYFLGRPGAELLDAGIQIDVG